MSDIRHPTGSEARQTKVVATLGPATDAPGVLERMVEAGLDVARFNLSHGNWDEHRRRLCLLRSISAKVRRPLAAMADLQGPKIRVGPIRGGSIRLEAGSRFTITSRDIEGNAQEVGTTLRGLEKGVRAGETILLHDGLIKLSVEEVKGEDLRCLVDIGGELGSHQGINLPNSELILETLTEKDRKDVGFILDEGFDLVALSFVRRAEDIAVLRSLVKGRTPALPIIAKIEKPQALEEIEEIIKVVDGVMVARGDLGVELSPELVPEAQKRIIRLCRRAGVPVITATEMLESMTVNPRPTRAEASDVANAIEDGTDAVMLSGETARGRYPVESVEMMTRICRTADAHLAAEDFLWRKPDAGLKVDDAIALAAAETATSVGASLIVAYTVSGHTARLVAKYRPKTPLVAICPRVEVSRSLALTWGVRAYEGPLLDSLDELPRQVEALCIERQIARPGDLVVITAGAPLMLTGVTNCLRIHRMGA